MHTSEIKRNQRSEREAVIKTVLPRSAFSLSISSSLFPHWLYDIRLEILPKFHSQTITANPVFSSNVCFDSRPTGQFVATPA